MTARKLVSLLSFSLALPSYLKKKKEILLTHCLEQELVPFLKNNNPSPGSTSAVSTEHRYCKM